MEHKTIAWQTEASESKTTLVSPDGRWHLDTEAKSGRPNRVALVNMDILGSPIGLAESEVGCWRDFMARCERYTEKLAKAMAEAKTILAELEANGRREA
ncbi:MAG: hypothetical protein ACI4WT_11705 [Oligosphaeraceae bacterium]